MKKIFLNILLLFYAFSFSQEITTVKGTILNANNNMPLENVNIVNLNKVIGTWVFPKNTCIWSMLRELGLLA